MASKIIVTGFLKTLTPLHIAAPSSLRLDLMTGQLSRSDIGTIPCNTVQKLGVMAMTKATEEQESRPFAADVPVIAANNIAGRIRRRVATEYLNALAELGGTVSISTYSAIMCGAATGNPDGVPISYDEYRRAKGHVFLGLLGGGPRMMERRARVHNALAYCSTTAELLDESRIPFDEIYQGGFAAAKAANFLNMPANQLTQTWTYRRNDDLRELVNIAQASATVSDFTNAFNARQAQIIEEAKAKGDSKTSTFTFQSQEFVLPGVAFPVVFELDDVSLEQAGLWFRGFGAFVREERLGGLGRNGFGEFVIRNGRVAVFEDGELASTEDLLDEGGYRMKAITAWTDAAEKQEAAEIEWLMRLPAEKKAKGVKAKAGAEE